MAFATPARKSQIETKSTPHRGQQDVIALIGAELDHSQEKIDGPERCLEKGLSCVAAPFAAFSSTVLCIFQIRRISFACPLEEANSM